MLKKIFHLSEEGSKAVMKASLCMTIFNLATLLPVILLAMVTNEMLNSYFGYTQAHISLWWYFGVSLALMVIIFLTYRLTYGSVCQHKLTVDLLLSTVCAQRAGYFPSSTLRMAHNARKG